MGFAFWFSIQYTPKGIKLRGKFILKKISSRILVLLMMIGVFGLLSNTVTQAATPEVVTVNIADSWHVPEFDLVLYLRLVQCEKDQW